TGTSRRDIGPGDHMGTWCLSRGVKGDWKRRSDGDSVCRDGRRGVRGGTSGARYDSERDRWLNMDGQHGRSTRNATTNVPEPS
ncbi:hypothetical protein J3R83DRAFT_3756, partial [Lanmaoa asiatica]